MRDVIKGELFKLRRQYTTASFLIFIAISAPVLVAFLVAVPNSLPSITLLERIVDNQSDLIVLIMQSSLAMCAVLGVIVVTQEYSNKSIYRLFLVSRNRVKALIAKLIAVSITIAVVSAVAGAIVAGLVLVFGQDGLTLARAVAIVLLFVIACVLMTAFAYGIALLIPRTIAALIVTLTLVLAGPDVLRSFLELVAPEHIEIVGYMPAQALITGVRFVFESPHYTGINPLIAMLLIATITIFLIACGLWLRGKKDV